MAEEQAASIQLLRTFAPLDGMKRENLAALAKKVSVRTLSRGRVLFSQGDTDKRTVWLVSGIVEVDDGERYRFGEAEAEIFFVPGHTRGHIAYAFREQKALFCGDTLFALGCGRMFEGTPQQMWTSLSRLRALPDDMRVYCAHEYTQSNARFALTVETDNDNLLKRSAAIDAARAKGEATVPSLLGEEKATNPFLRADMAAVQKAVGMPGGDPVAVFAEVRHRKDVFR